MDSLIKSKSFNIGKLQGQLAMVDTRIFGAYWAGTSSPTLTRTQSAVGKSAAVGVDSAFVTNDFDKLPIWKDIVEERDRYGNIFIRIPKFYIKKIVVGITVEWQVSLWKHPGFYLPWCFWDFTNNKEKPYVLYGKYNASLSVDSLRLESKPGTIPLVSRNIVDFRTLAKANGSGYQLLDIHAVDVINTLMTIEFATLDIQTLMQGYTTGPYSASHVATVAENAVNRIILATTYAANYRVGQTIDIGTSLGGRQIAQSRVITGITVYNGTNSAIAFDGAAVNVAIGNIVYNVGAKSGLTNNVNATTGSPTSNSDGKWPVKYRGIENPFGNVWQWVDGVNINERQAWICRNADDFASNVFASPYRQLGYTNVAADGYVTVMGYDANNPEAEFATSVGGSNTTHYADYNYQATGQRVARVGGYWNNDRNAGSRYWALNSSASDVYLTAGGRFLKKPL